MENKTQIPEGYMKDAAGRLVPESIVKPTEKLEDQLVTKIIDYARALSDQISRFKGHTGDDIAAYLSLIDEKYGVKKGGRKGNMTFQTYDGLKKVQVAISENITFGAFAKICLRNRILSYIRYFHENKNPESLDDIDSDPEMPAPETPEQIILNKESLHSLNQRIDGMLTDFEKSVLTLYISNMSYTDMAKSLSKPKKSIDNAIHRIKAKLRKLLS